MPVLPNDKNGKLLTEGNVVSVQCLVRQAHDGGSHGFVVLEPIDKAPGHEHAQAFALNSTQCEFVSDVLASPAQSVAEASTDVGTPEAASTEPPKE